MSECEECLVAMQPQGHPPGVVDGSQGEGGDSMCLQQLREERLHLALIVTAPLLQLHSNLLQFLLDIHLVLKLTLETETERQTERQRERDRERERERERESDTCM